MTEKELHIITLGDIFKNIETEEKAFKFLGYIKQLQQELTKYKKRCEKVVGYINNYDVFKEFSFPLMKRDEENQVKSSIQYEFDTSIKKDLLEILEGKEEE